jgi:hypothetical protein
MARLSRDEVRTILEPFHQRILDVMKQAFSDWRALAELKAQNGLPATLYSRTTSNDVFDFIASRAMAEFRTAPSVTVRPEAQTFKLIFKGTVGARYKRGDEDDLGQNIPTGAALALEQADGELPGFPPETAWVEFIWQANDLLTRLDYVLVVARDGNTVLWSYEIEDIAGAGGGSIAPFSPPTPPAPQPPKDDKLITAKKSKAKKPHNNKE